MPSWLITHFNAQSGKEYCSDLEILIEKDVFFELCYIVSDFPLVNYILNGKLRKRIAVILKF